MSICRAQMASQSLEIWRLLLLLLEGDTMPWCFFMRQGSSDDEAAVVDKVEVKILCILYIYIYCNYNIYVIN